MVTATGLAMLMAAVLPLVRERLLKAMKNGEKLSNNIVPNDLSQFERNHLRDAFQIIAKHQKGALFRFSGGRGVL